MGKFNSGWIAGMIPTNRSMKLLNQKGLIFPSSILVSIYITNWSYYNKCTLLSKNKKKKFTFISLVYRHRFAMSMAYIRSCSRFSYITQTNMVGGPQSTNALSFACIIAYQYSIGNSRANLIKNTLWQTSWSNCRGPNLRTWWIVG